MSEHIPVLVQEVVYWLRPEEGGNILDGTLGLGGHALSLLQAGCKDLCILGIDRDRESLEQADRRLQEQGFADRVVLGHASFDQFPRVMKEAGLDYLNGVLLDLGISNLQIQDASRGFSFLACGSLDMRFDQSGGDATARDLINQASQDRLREIVKKYGEEPMAARIARRITEARSKSPISDTHELAEIVSSAYPRKKRAQMRNHPATRTFQALRIAVNSELEKLQAVMQMLPRYLAPGARIAIISYHSLEDRIVKRNFRKQAENNTWQVMTKKPITPSAAEIEKNRKSRSAKLRVAEVLKSQGMVGFV